MIDVNFSKITLFFLYALLLNANIETLFATSYTENFETNFCKTNNNSHKTPDLTYRLWWKFFDNLSLKDILAVRSSSKQMNTYVSDYLNSFFLEIPKLNTIRFQDVTLSPARSFYGKVSLFKEQMCLLATIKTQDICLLKKNIRSLHLLEYSIPDSDLTHIKSRCYYYGGDHYFPAIEEPYLRKTRTQRSIKDLSLLQNLISLKFEPQKMELVFIEELCNVIRAGHLKNLVYLNLNQKSSVIYSNGEKHFNLLNNLIKEGYLTNLRILKLNNVDFSYPSKNK